MGTLLGDRSQVRVIGSIESVKDQPLQILQKENRYLLLCLFPQFFKLTRNSST